MAIETFPPSSSSPSDDFACTAFALRSFRAFFPYTGSDNIDRYLTARYYFEKTGMGDDFGMTVEYLAATGGTIDIAFPTTLQSGVIVVPADDVNGDDFFHGSELIASSASTPSP